MTLKELVGKVPEADRVEAEKAIQEAVTAANPLATVTTKEQAGEFIKNTPVLKAAFDVAISKVVKDHDERFKAEELPKLLEAEVKKITGPETDPIKLELAQIKEKLAKSEETAAREKRRGVALKVAADEGIPADDLDRFLDGDEEKTTDTVKQYAARLKAWAKVQTETALKQKIGDVGAPKGGTPEPPADFKAQYQALLKTDPDKALKLMSEMERAMQKSAKS